MNHNFVNSYLVAGNTFTVTIDLLSVGGATTNGQGVAFGLGMSLTEALSLDDAVGNTAALPHLSNAFGTGLAQQTGAVADFWVALRADRSVAWGSHDTIFGTAAVSANVGTLSATFGVANFNQGSQVGYQVALNGTSINVAAGNFTWSGTNENYIAFDGRGPFVLTDNLAITSPVPEPAACAFGLLGCLGLIARRRRAC